MKKKLNLILFVLFSIFSLNINAHDFEMVNSDGKTIYYDITSSADLTVSVSYRGSSYSNYTNEYKGDISIPSSVSYNGETYSVISIGYSAFRECDGLTSVTIPNSVTSIGNYAFYDCDSLTSATIPNSVTSIGNYAFYGCSGLTSVTIPNSVTSIGEDAFAYCALTSITIPNSVTSIGSSAFSCCSGLTSVTIPNSVTSIGYQAFYGCWGLTSITIPNSVTSIGHGAFYGCRGLTSVTIPNSVTSIGSSAFWGCSGLSSVTIGNSVTSIGIFAFDRELTSIIVDEGNIKYDSREDCNAIIESETNTLISGCKSTIIPNSVTSIGDDAFYGCWGLTSITIPNSVTSIGEDAFSYCDGLTSITIPNSVTSIGSSAFCGCSSLTTIIVDEGNSKYDSREDCNAIIESETNTLISGCKSTIIPNSVTSIGDDAFYFCDALTSVTIPNSVTSIGNYAFYNCSGLTSVTIGNSVTSIGDDAFSSCHALTEIFSLSSDPAVCDASSFWGVDKTIPVYIPFGSKSAYKSAAEWNEFKNFIESEFTGVEENEISASDIKVISGNGIEINDYYGRIRIVNLAGQVIKDAYVNGSIQISLPKGVYIVVTENNSQKVIL